LIDVTTLVRHQPFEYLIASGFYWFAVLAVGLLVVAVTCHAVTVFAAAAVTHGNIRLPDWIERALQPVVITLDLHLVDHSLSPAEANAIFGTIFSISDRLFGIYLRLPAKTSRH
jgi:sterol desaturase/sphingolipid hydroxylase (fatty acid hydroxylase superfamily)